MEDKRKIEGWIIDEADISKKDWKEIMKKWVIAESKLSKKTSKQLLKAYKIYKLNK